MTLPPTHYTSLLSQELVRQLDKETQPDEQRFAYFYLDGDCVVLVGFGKEFAQKCLRLIEEL